MGQKQHGVEGQTSVPPGLQALYRSLKEIKDSAQCGVDKPEAVTRMVVLDALMLFAKLTGRPPRLIHIPPSLEAVLQIDRGQNLGMPSKTHGKLREHELVFTCRPVWDAAEFRVE